MKISYEFNPFEILGIDVPRDKRPEALEAVASFVEEEVLSYVGDSNSPVSGEGKFPALSPAYKKRKAEESSSVKPNMELSGNMLDALEVKRVNSSTLSLEIAGAEAEKAESHNHHMTDSHRNPKRRFIPAKGQTFKREIWTGIRDILEEYEEKK